MGGLKLSLRYLRKGTVHRCLSSLSSSAQLPPINPRPEIKHNKIFINNEFVDALSGKTFETVNPATEEVICKLPAGQKEDIDLAVTAAKTAFHHGSEWRIMTAPQRGLCLSRLANLIERDRVELASLESLDTGKPCRETFFADLQATINIYQYYAGWADKIQGSTVPIDIDHFSYTRREPVGVVGAIIPWNFPLVMQAIKLAPALACGNAVVMKPAEQTSLTALHVAHLIREAGFPAGVVNIVTGFGEEAGASIAEHMNIDKVAFTGSTEVGRRIQDASARSNLKRTTLELGGKSPMIIFKDADLEYAVEVAHQALFYNQGQVCFAGSRTFVEDSIYDEFVLRCAQRAKRRVIGDPFNFQTEHGPQIDKQQLHKILNLIKLGKEEGATLECGGNRHGDRGYFVQPTVFSNVENAMEIAQKEIFGPVQQIIRFKDVNSLVEQANASIYGLAAGIITNDFNTALKLSHLIDAGTVWINCYHVMCPQLSFGGFKMSGFGRELGNYGLEQYTEVKTITMRIPGCNL